MSTNWDEIDANSKSNDYLPYAPEGEHETTVATCDMVKSRVKGTPGLEFTLESSADYTFPKYGTTHYSFTTTNINWRKKHNRDLMIVLGATKSNAEKAVDVCEGKGDQDAMIKAYEDAFKRLVSRHPKVKVAVFKRRSGDKYTTWDFAEYSVRMGRPEEDAELNVLDDAEPVEINDLPF